MVQFYNPDTEAEVKRRRRMAEALMTAGKQPEKTEVVGGFAVPISPLASLARGISGGYGAYQEGQANELELEAAKRRQEMIQSVAGQIGTNPSAAGATLLQDPSTMSAGFNLIQEDARNKRALEIAKFRAGGYMDPETGEWVQTGAPKPMTESQSNAATYADRIAQDQAILNDPVKMKASTSFGQKALDWINPFGEGLNSADYQAYKQAKGDFTTAKLRKESGAAIGQGEFDKDERLYFPKPGDDEATLKQKARNREIIAQGMKRSAGSSYKPLVVTPPEAAGASAGKYIGKDKKTGKPVYQMPDGSYEIDE